MDTKNKEVIKQVGKMVGASTAAGAGIGVAGALINKKIKKKKESDSMDKQAFNLVNETFNKIAGVKDVMTGKNVRRAINDVKGGKAVIDTFKGNLKNLEPSARQGTREAINVMTKDLSRLKGRVVKEGAKTVGAYAAPVAGIAGVGAIARKKKQEKTAFDITEEAFGKIAGFNMEDLLPAETLKKMKDMADKGKDTVESLKTNTGNGTNFNGKLSNVKPGAPTLEQIKQMGASKKGMSPKTKTAIGAGIAAASLLGGAMAHKKINKKKQEKTAFDIVSDTFEKIAK